MPNIDKFIEIINEKLNQVSKIIRDFDIDPRIDSLLKAIKEKRFVELTYKDYSDLCDVLGDSIDLKCKDYIVKLVDSPEFVIDSIKKISIPKDEINYRQYFIQQLELKKQEQKEQIRNNDEKKYLNILKTIRNKLLNPSVELINNKELMLIYELSEDLDMEEKFDLYTYIFKINEEIMSRLNIDSELDIEEDIIDESSLIETNVNLDALENLFAKYDISVLNVPYSPSEKDEYDSLIELLVKYADFNNIISILDYLSNENINLLDCIKPDNLLTLEYFVKTLIYSNVEDIQKVASLSNANSIDFKDVVWGSPQVLFPTSKSVIGVKRGARVPHKSGSGDTPHVSGALKYFADNISFFNSIGIDAEQAYRKCPSAFFKSSAIKKKAAKDLALYGIDCDKIKNCISILNSNLKLDLIDTAVESLCLDEATDNLTFLLNGEDFKFVKYLRSIGVSYDDIFTQTNRVRRKNVVSFLPAGSIEDEYKAVDVYTVNGDLYKRIIESQDCSTIDPMVLNSSYIKSLDEQFRTSEFTYTFETRNLSVTISRIKVLRILSALTKSTSVDINMDSLLYALTYNSLLDKNEELLISSAVKSLGTRGI